MLLLCTTASAEAVIVHDAQAEDELRHGIGGHPQPE